MAHLGCIEEKYSPLAHLASIVCPWWMNPGDVILGMLSFALDVGGDESRPVYTVAGFGSSEQDWRSFSELWSERLRQEGITYFRAVEAAHFREQFQPFHDRPDREVWRKRLFEDLMDILKRHVYRKFGCSIINDALKKMDDDVTEEFSLSAYSLAGRTTEKTIRQWILSEWTKTTPVVIVFEAGDKGIGKLQKRLTEDGCFPPTFRPKKDTPGKDGIIEYGYVPLQAADWLAYELSIAVRQIDAGEVEEIAQLRWPMQQFHSTLGEPGVYGTENIKELEMNLKTTQEILKWEKSAGLDHLRAKRRRAASG
jgi:hypothetical protein